MAYAARLDIPHFSAASAGIRAVIGHPIHPEAALVLQKLGGETSDFAARQLTPKIAAGADLVLTMTRAQRDAVLEFAPRHLHRTFTLGSAARLVTQFAARDIADLAALRPQLATNELFDIPDPIGQKADFHATVGSQIARLVPPILKLCQST